MLPILDDLLRAAGTCTDLEPVWDLRRWKSAARLSLFLACLDFPCQRIVSVLPTEELWLGRAMKRWRPEPVPTCLLFRYVARNLDEQEVVAALLDEFPADEVLRRIGERLCRAE